MLKMNAFISYSHQDEQMLTTLHKHLTQLQRDNIISAWTDREILAGGDFNKDISTSLEGSKLFLALLSPDYIASRYCYEIEFKTALDMHRQGRLTIVPIVVEPCDWQNTPFGQFKALPKDGKAVSTWENKNTAFLDVVQNLRKLANAADSSAIMQVETGTALVSVSRNYKVKKDFDSIQKLKFIRKTFEEVTDYLKRYIQEVVQLDGIDAMTSVDTPETFEGLIVNRNKIATEAGLKVVIKSDQQNAGYARLNEGEIAYTIAPRNKRGSSKGLSLSFDEYHLFWTQKDLFYGNIDKKELLSKEIAELIWNEWLEVVGIL